MVLTLTQLLEGANNLGHVEHAIDGMVRSQETMKRPFHFQRSALMIWLSHNRPSLEAICHMRTGLSIPNPCLMNIVMMVCRRLSTT